MYQWVISMTHYRIGHESFSSPSIQQSLALLFPPLPLIIMKTNLAGVVCEGFNQLSQHTYHTHTHTHTHTHIYIYIYIYIIVCIYIYIYIYICVCVCVCVCVCMFVCVCVCTRMHARAHAHAHATLNYSYVSPWSLTIIYIFKCAPFDFAQAVVG